MIGPPVLVVRAAPGAGASARRLRRKGFAALACPVMRAAPIAPPQPREFPSELAAFALTSAEGVRALAALVSSPAVANGGDRRGLLHRPVFAVGAATARAADRAGFTDIRARDVENGAGDAAALALAIGRALSPQAGPILHIAGAAAGFALVNNLQNQGFSAEYWPVYEMRAAVRLARPVRTVLAEPVAGAILFYAAEAAEHFLSLVRAAGLGPRLGAWTALTLAPRIAERIEAALAAPDLLHPSPSLAFAAIHPAARPDEDMLFRTLEAHFGDQAIAARRRLDPPA